MNIGKFTKVHLREIWKHEALDFTNWLALEENLGLLGETLGISILNSQTEVGVGKFAVDILAEDEAGKPVIIETHRKTIEEHLGTDIEWMELPDKKASRIKQSAPFDLANEKKWPEYFAWLLYRAESFHKTFNQHNK